MPSVSFDWPLEGIKIVTPGVYLVSLEVSAQVMFIQWNPTYSVRAPRVRTRRGRWRRGPPATAKPRHPSRI